MEESTLLKISLVSALVGIIIILFSAETITAPYLTIDNITKDHIDKTIRTGGLITSSKETPGLILINLKDSTGEITAIIFKDKNITISRYLPVEVTAKVVEYEDELELQIEEIKIISQE